MTPEQTATAPNLADWLRAQLRSRLAAELSGWDHFQRDTDEIADSATNPVPAAYQALTAATP